MQYFVAYIRLMVTKLFDSHRYSCDFGTVQFFIVNRRSYVCKEQH